MADVFNSTDAHALLDGKYILFFGDSNMRALYKDVITLYKRNMLITDEALRRKLERSFEGDSLIRSTGLIKGRGFKEHRCFKENDTQVEFCFVTNCLSPDVTNTLEDIKAGKKRTPDVLFMNSTLWDITRWGFESVALFKKNLTDLVCLFKKCLPSETLVIWQTAPPLSASVQKAFLVPEVEFMKYTIRFEAMQANIFAHDIFTSNGFDLLDFHYHLRLNVLSRKPDGVHWVSKAVRYMTNLFLTHISIAWERPLPGRFASLQLDELKESLIEFREVDKRLLTSTSPSLAPLPNKMKVEGVPAEAQPIRIAAKHRLGEVVSPVKEQPQEDLRTRLKNGASSLNTNNPKSANNNRIVTCMIDKSVNNNRIVTCMTDKSVNNNRMVTCMTDECVDSSRKVACMIDLNNMNSTGNRTVQSTSNHWRGPFYHTKPRSRGPAKYSNSRNQQNMRGGGGHYRPAHPSSMYQKVQLRFSPYPRTPAHW